MTHYHPNQLAHLVPSTYMLIVDTNAGEDDLYAALVRRVAPNPVTRRRLDVGDAVLAPPEGERTLVIERKTWLDWGKSLRDGRYEDQKARLLADGEGSTTTVIYIL